MRANPQVLWAIAALVAIAVLREVLRGSDKLKGGQSTDSCNLAWS
jgi:hypothetical protein